MYIDIYVYTLDYPARTTKRVELPLHTPKVFFLTYYMYICLYICMHVHICVCACAHYIPTYLFISALRCVYIYVFATTSASHVYINICTQVFA